MKTLKFLFTILFISCQVADKSVSAVEFNVNKTLLADSSFVSKTGLSINPPKNWSKTENYNSELQNKVLYRLDNKLIAIYKSDSANCALVISEVPETNFDIIKGLLDKPDFYYRTPGGNVVLVKINSTTVTAGD
jgi:hypothetical protein